jgi:hypothetical protein
VETLAGGDLFEFGDRDGTGDAARLQHPLGVLYADGAVYVADTYNHKIKRLDPGTRAVKTFAGTGKPGHADGTRASFYEPGGLSAANNKLYVADTNNHAVRVVDLASGQTSTLAPARLAPARHERADDGGERRHDARAQRPKRSKSLRSATTPRARRRVVRDRGGSSTGEGALVVEVALPAGYHLNELAPHRLQATVERGAEQSPSTATRAR